MFFVKALGGSIVVVFGGFWALGGFDHEQQVLDGIATVRQAEIADNKTAKWGSHCNKLRDKVFGMDGGAPVRMGPTNGLEAIATVHKAARELEAAGCDPDAAPGAFSPFEPDKHEFREVTNGMVVSPLERSPPRRNARPTSAAPVVHEDGGWGKPKP